MRRRGRLLECRWFFDRAPVIQATTRAERRVLNHAGGLTRKIARQSIRKRKRISQPGSPPSSRAGHLRRFILYHYDRARAVVVIGPVKFPSRNAYVVPEILEFGGTVTRRRRGQRIRARYQARPYMRPALDKVAPRFPALWQGSIRATG